MGSGLPLRTPESERSNSNRFAISMQLASGKSVTLKDDLGRIMWLFEPGAPHELVASRLERFPDATAWVDGEPMPTFTPSECGNAYLEKVEADKATALSAAKAAESGPLPIKGAPPWRKAPSAPAPTPAVEIPPPGSEPEPEPEPEQPEPAADETQPGDDDADEDETDEAEPAEAIVADPVDLWDHFGAPELPRGLLPGILERYAIKQAEQVGADCGGLGMSALVICAAAIRDRIKLQVKRHDSEWCESARLWVALIGLPSTKKSPIIGRAFKPIGRIDARLRREYLTKKTEYDKLAAADKALVSPPPKNFLRLDDTTIEAAQEILKDSRDGVILMQDELSGWFGSMEKYSNGRGAHKDRGFWLQSFNGGSASVDRITRGSGFIENLSISILGGIQPDLMRKFAADGIDDGLLQRLFPIVLRSAAEGRDQPADNTMDDFSDLIERLHALEPPSLTSGSLPPVPTELRFSDGAQAFRNELETKHQKQMAGWEVVNKKLAAHIGKYDGLFARLCVIWHCVENAHQDSLPRAVTEDTARRVAKFLHSFLLQHAISFYADLLGLADGHERIVAVAGYILAHKLERVTNRDVQRGDRTMRKLERRDIESVFEQLDAFGWVSRLPGPRPSDPPHWQVNPEVHRKFAERGKQEKKRREDIRRLIADSVQQQTNDRDA
jgi:hypothetical protein